MRCHHNNSVTQPLNKDHWNSLKNFPSLVQDLVLLSLNIFLEPYLNPRNSYPLSRHKREIVKRHLYRLEVPAHCVRSPSSALCCCLTEGVNTKWCLSKLLVTIDTHTYIMSVQVVRPMSCMLRKDRMSLSMWWLQKDRMLVPTWWLQKDRMLVPTYSGYWD